MKKEDKTNNGPEGFHRWFNSLLMQKNSFQNIFKSINVLRHIYKIEDVNIDEALAGKRHRQRTKVFEERDEKIRKILEVYLKQETLQTKLRQLHLIAAKLTIDVNTDIQDETVTDD